MRLILWKQPDDVVPQIPGVAGPSSGAICYLHTGNRALVRVWITEGDMSLTPGPPALSALDERISYDRYGAGLYVTGYTQIGNDL